MVSATAGGSEMTKLEDRLRKVPGVADLTLELGGEGLGGIRVRIGAEADEAIVLDEIRRVLVAYGLTSRQPTSRGDRLPLPRLDAELTATGGMRLLVRPGGPGLEVVLIVDGETLVARGERSPIGAVTAMARVVARQLDCPMPRRIGIVRDRLDELDVVTVVVRSDDVAGVGAALASPSLSVGVYRAVGAALVSAHRP